MEVVNKDNINRFYNGEKIFHINPLNGKEEIIKFVCKDNEEEVIVRVYEMFDLYLDGLGRATSLADFEIVSGYYYFYTSEKDVYRKQIEWYQKQIEKIEEKLFC